MDYEFWFWMGVAYVAGRISTRPLFYYGRDEAKYERAWFAIMPE